MVREGIPDPKSGRAESLVTHGAELSPGELEAVVIFGVEGSCCSCRGE